MTEEGNSEIDAEAISSAAFSLECCINCRRHGEIR